MLAASCGGSSSYQTAAITEVSTGTKVVLRSSDADALVTGIRIRGKSDLDGTAEIALMLNGERYRVERLSGSDGFFWGGDWYSPTAEVQYRPIDARAGKVELIYRFETISAP